MKTYWFIDEYNIVRPLYKDGDWIFSPNLDFKLVISKGKLLFCEEDMGELLVYSSHNLYESLTELAKVIEE